MSVDRNAFLRRVHDAAATARVIRLRPSRFARTSAPASTMAPLPSARSIWDEDGDATFERNKAQLTRRLFSAGYMEF